MEGAELKVRVQRQVAASLSLDLNLIHVTRDACLLVTMEGPGLEGGSEIREPWRGKIYS